MSFSKADNLTDNEESMLRIDNGRIGTKKFVHNFLDYIQSQENITLSKEIFENIIIYFIEEQNEGIPERLFKKMKYIIQRIIHVFPTISEKNVEFATKVINFKISKCVYKYNLMKAIRKYFEGNLQEELTSDQLMIKICSEFHYLQSSDLVFKLMEIHVAYYQHYIFSVLFSHQYDCISGKHITQLIFTEIRNFFNNTFKRLNYSWTKLNERIRYGHFYMHFLIFEINLLKSLNENLKVTTKLSKLQVNMFSREIHQLIISSIKFPSKRFKYDELLPKITNLLQSAFGNKNSDSVLNFENKIIHFLLRQIADKYFKEQNLSFMKYEKSDENVNDEFINTCFMS